MSSSAVSPSDDILLLAERALLEGHPEATVELCRQLLSQHPEHVAALFLEAEAHRDLRDTDLAAHGYRRVIATEPAHAEAWAGLGSACFDAGDMEEAGRCFARAIRLRADLPDAYYGRALVRERRGDDPGAARDYLRAWRLSDRYPLPRYLEDIDAVALLHEAAEAAAPEVRAWLDHAPVLIQELPDTLTCLAYDPPASPSELLGHVAAQMPGEGSIGSWTTLPPAVLLYRRNLARYADDRAELVRAVRESVVSQVEEWIHGNTLSE